jgi:thioredoxin 1
MAERSNRTATGVVHLSGSTFDETVAPSRGLLMVDFWADWCAPCRALAPVLEDLAAASGGRVTLAKVNVDENLELAERYDIRSIPTVLFFRSGEVVDRVTGAVSKAALQDILNARA